MNKANYPKYYVNDDNFPFEEVVCDPNNPEHLRSSLSKEGLDLVIFRYWREKERHAYNPWDTVEATKEEFDLWVEYWKIYWEIEAAKESGDTILQAEKEAELQKIDDAICKYRQRAQKGG